MVLANRPHVPLALAQLVKGSPVQLPVEALVDQLADESLTEPCKNFTKMYIDMGWPRLKGAAPRDAQLQRRSFG